MTSEQNKMKGRSGSIPVMDFLSRTLRISTVWKYLMAKVGMKRRNVKFKGRPETFYRMFFELAHDAIFLMQGDRFIECNPATLRMFGCRKEDIINERPMRFSPALQPDGGDSGAKALGKIHTALSGVSVLFEWRHCRLDGSEFDAEVSLNRVDLGGEPYLQAIVRDITERKRSEEALRIAHDQLLNIIEFLPDPTFVVDRDKKVIAWNHAIEILSGVPKEKMLGQGDYGYAVPFFGRRQPILIDLLDGPAGEVDPAYKFVRKVGDKVYAESFLPIIYQGKGAHLWGVAAPLYDRNGTRWGAIEAIRDVTDRVKAAESLSESEERFRAAFENGAIAMAITSLHHKLLRVNKAFCQMLGFSEGELVGRSFTEITYPDDIEKNLIELRRINDGIQNLFRIEKRYIRKDGAVIWADMSTACVRDAQGSPLYIITHVQDITDRKRAESEVQRLKNYLSNIINSMPSILVGMDQKGTVIQWNKLAEQMSGIAAGDAVGKSLKVLLPDFSPWIDSLQGKIEQHHPASLEKLLLVKDGERHFYDVVLYPLEANGVEGTVVRIEEVTEQARIQELMVQTEKMVLVGGLAAGMAHEINNPLGIITQAVQNIERRLSPELPANQRVAEELGLRLELLKTYFDRREIPIFIKDIQAASSRAARIIVNMLQFSRKSEAVHQQVRLSEVLEKAVELAANDYDLKKRYDFWSVEIIREYEPDLPVVPVITVEMEQVFLNLLKNAAQAMAANPPERKPRITLRLRRERDYAVAEVEDNGPGMEETVLRRIFEPFFTTKGPGVGTGLGLSVSYMIVTQNHKGLISVESTPGTGTRFTVKLPFLPKE